MISGLIAPKIALGQMVTPTHTALHVGLVGQPGTETLDMVASVSTGAQAILAGQVVFRLNGVPIKTVQVVGQMSSLTHPKGSAEFRSIVAAGTYAITANFEGTSLLAPSSSDSLTFTVPPLAHAFLAASFNTDASVLSFDLSSVDKPAGLSGALYLRQVASDNTIAKQEFSTTSTKSSTLITDVVFPFSPSSFLQTDLTDAGTEDFVVGNSAASTVEIYWQQPDGSYKQGVSLEVGGSPGAILAGDFNGDGLVDLAVLEQRASSLVVFLQDAANPGNFHTLSQRILVGHAAQSMVLGDFDHDGYPDIAVANFADNTVSILNNSASSPGHFVAGTTLSTGGGPSSIITGDLLGRGMADLATSNYYDGTITVFANVPGKNIFSPLPEVSKVGAGPSSLSSCDLNGDGVADLAVANSLDGTISVLLGSRSNPGEYPTQWIQTDLHQPTSVLCQVMSSGKQLPSLLVSTGDDGGVVILRNNADGTFPRREYLSTGSMSNVVQSVHAFAADSFLLGVLDSSLKMIHFVSRSWLTSGAIDEAYLPNNNVSGVVLSLVGNAKSELLLESGVLAVSDPPKKPQLVAFPALRAATYGDAPISLAASSDSGLPISYVLTCGSSNLSGNVLTITDVGWVCITANQLGDSTYLPARPVEQMMYVYRRPLFLVPTAAQRLFGMPNPVFTGSISGSVQSDNLEVVFLSASDQGTRPGVYSSQTLGITGSLLPSPASGKYFAITLGATLTVCPTVQAILLHVDISVTIASCPSLIVGSPSPSPVGMIPMPPSVPISTTPPNQAPLSGPVQVGSGNKQTSTPISGHPEPPVTSSPATGPGDSGTSGLLPVQTPSALPLSPGGGLATSPLSGGPLLPVAQPESSPPISLSPNSPAPKPVLPVKAPKLPPLSDPTSPVPPIGWPGTAPKTPTYPPQVIALPVVTGNPVMVIKTKQATSSTTDVRIVPIPIPIPIPRLRAKQATSTSDTSRKAHASVEILEDSMNSAAPGLLRAVVIFECSTADAVWHRAFVEVDDRLIGVLNLKSGKPTALILPMGIGKKTALRVRTLGTVACPTASSSASWPTASNLPLIELEESVITALIPESISVELQEVFDPYISCRPDCFDMKRVPIDPALPWDQDVSPCTCCSALRLR